MGVEYHRIKHVAPKERQQCDYMPDHIKMLGLTCLRGRVGHKGDPPCTLGQCTTHPVWQQDRMHGGVKTPRPNDDLVGVADGINDRGQCWDRWLKATLSNGRLLRGAHRHFANTVTAV